MAPITDPSSPASEIPANRIFAASEVVVPEMFPLVSLSQTEIDAIVASVPGGAANVQDIYPLLPLQEGILFHHLSVDDGDLYLIANLLSFRHRTDLDRYITALQKIIDRHEVLRTAVRWEGLPRPVQVVMRQATLLVEEIEVQSALGEVIDQLNTRFDPRSFRVDVREAPLIRIYEAYDAARERWLMVQLTHHLAVDHRSLELIQLEIEACLQGRLDELAAPIKLRSLVAAANLDVSEEEHETFFRKMLGDLDEPTVPFGFDGSRAGHSDIEESSLTLSRDLTRRLRDSARQLGIGPARIFHLAWAVVLAKISGRADVVFGTVLSTRERHDDDSDRVIGPLVNTLPIRVRVDENSVETGLRCIHVLLGDLLHHQHTSLTIAQSCSGLASSVPLFSALFNYRHNSAELQLRSTQDDQASKGIHRLQRAEYTEYPFSFSIDNFAEYCTLTSQTPSAIGSMRVCKYMATALSSLADALESAPATPMRTLRVLPDEELHQVLYGWNKTQTDYFGVRCVQTLFETQARTSPNATALIFGDAGLTFTELNRKANQLAHHLRELGVGPDERVAVYLDRGFEMIIALLAVLKAGGAYVPFDPTYPVERLQFMLKDCTPVALLTREHLRDVFRNSAIPVLDLVADSFQWQDRPTDDPVPHAIGLDPRNLAYVIYTSGSTGTPKGVAMPHEALANMLQWQMGQSNVFHARHVLQFAALGFDVAFQEIFSTLCSGATLILISEAERLDSDKLLEFTVRRNIERLFLPYAALRVIAESANNSLRIGERTSCPLKEIITAGEQLRIEANVSQFMKGFGHCTLQNQYGPTETHVATSFTLSAEIANWPLLPPIGRPIANMRVYILDVHQEPIPVGVIGELYIAGMGVARGYVNRPELTAERFLPDPFTEEPYQRMYRTGDLGRFLPDGNIEFLGRNDFQVKFRGFRVELGEIEARLTDHPAVREAVVVARETTPGDKQLVAYYTVPLGLAEGEVLPREHFRAYLLGILPAYMVPTSYVRMKKLPLTPSGKLDRRSLPTPEQVAFTADSYAPPVGKIEEALAQIWAELLHIDHVGRNDDFFALGGHSLLAMRMISRIRQSLSGDIGLRDLFARPVLADLASRLEGHGGVPLPSIPKRQRKQQPDASSIITATRSDGSRIASRDRGATWYEILTRQES
jgi:amino acid adenylation domain-containing protein